MLLGRKTSIHPLYYMTAYVCSCMLLGANSDTILIGHAMLLGRKTSIHPLYYMTACVFLHFIWREFWHHPDRTCDVART